MNLLDNEGAKRVPLLPDNPEDRDAVLLYLLGHWGKVLGPEFEKPYFQKILLQVDADKHRLQPSPEDVFRAFRLTSPRNTRVVILGQDPYPVGADGLAFSHESITPSLKVIFQAMEREHIIRTKTELDDWSEQGVLLLNTTLTTTFGRVDAHKGIGWDKFVWQALDVLFKTKAAARHPLVIMTWGKPAKTLLESIPSRGASALFRTISTVHPAALKHNPSLRFDPGFQDANDFLAQWNEPRIKWSD